jgi:UDP-glucose 4-epimerase
VIGEVIHPEFQDPRPGDIFRSVGDPSLAAEILNFKPTIELREGLAETSAWMKGAGHE